MPGIARETYVVGRDIHEDAEGLVSRRSVDMAREFKCPRIDGGVSGIDEGVDGDCALLFCVKSFRHNSSLAMTAMGGL